MVKSISSLLAMQNVFCRKVYAIYGWFVPCFAGGSESSWDKDKLQSPITTGSQHSIGHPTLSGQSSLGSAHPLSPLQQNHLLTNSTYRALRQKKYTQPCLEAGLALLPIPLEVREMDRETHNRQEGHFSHCLLRFASCPSYPLGYSHPL